MSGVAAPLSVEQAFRTAVEHEQAGRLDDAEQLLTRILQTAPNQPDTLHELGVLAARRKDFAGAADLIERALVKSSNAGLYYRNVCEIYRRLGRLNDAVSAASRAVELNKDDPHSLVNLAIICYACCRFAEGAACAEKAIALAPDLASAHFELAEAFLVEGKFERGWEEYEWRFQIPGAAKMLPQTDRPLWDGKPLDGTLLLVADQGFGDVIQFGRFIPWAQSICRDLVVAASHEMHSLITQIMPGVQLTNRWDAIPAFSAYVTLSGLPRLYGVRGHNIPAVTPYLLADPQRVKTWQAKVDVLVPTHARRIGIVWAGRPEHNNDFNRSMRLAQLAPIAGLDGIALISLQKGPSQSEIGSYYGAAPLLNLGPALVSYEDTMAVIDGLDLVITVDTSIAHLAGAMNRPAWVMLPFAPDWRWLMHRTDSPWYPSLRLFRQSKPGDWSPVVEQIAALVKEDSVRKTA